MCMLSDRDIIEAIGRGHIHIEPYQPRICLQPSSYDLRLDADVTLQPGEFALLSTLEYVKLDKTVQGQIHGRSSMAREGVMVHISAGFVDPGFEGTLTLECVNFSSEPRTYHKGDRICQIAFTRLYTPAVNPYKGRYKGQVGATPSRRTND